jgi:hypothetical protein
MKNVTPKPFEVGDVTHIGNGTKRLELCEPDRKTCAVPVHIRGPARVREHEVSRD